MAEVDSNFVKRELERLAPSYGLKIQSNRAWVRCPFHSNGNESTPSLMVTIEKRFTDKGVFGVGTAKCMACGQFIPHWNVLAERLNLDKVNDDGSVIAKSYPLFDDRLSSVALDKDDVKPLDLSTMTRWDAKHDWRTIKGKLMRNVGARIMFNETIQRKQAYLPVWVQGEHIGGVRANLVKIGKRNYFNTDGTWVKSSALYPYDYTKNMLIELDLSTVMLVEGARDALKSIQYGIPALGILGTGNWSERKAELVLALGVNRVIIGFDPDNAGRKATVEVNDTLKNDVWIRKFSFTDGMDPGAMTPDIAERIKKHLR